MTVLKRSDGTLLFYNAIPVDDATLAQLRALGTPKQLIVPNQFHALDAAAFAHRLGLTAYCPTVAIEPLASRLTCLPIAQLPLDAGLEVFSVEGFKTHEAVLLLGGKTLLLADLITNVPHQGGFYGLMMRFIGFTGPKPVLPRPVRKRVGRDLPAVGALMRKLAAIETLSRIIPSHGAIIETNAREALREASLDVR